MRRIERGKLLDVLFPNALIAELFQRFQSCNDGKEQGGLLLGYRKTNALQIVSYTRPQKGDYATPTLFRRGVQGHKRAAYNEWLRSGKITDWLGEWHTHPGGVALPSITDRSNWVRLTQHTKKPMAFLILSDRAIFVGLQQRRPLVLQRLRLIEQNKDAALYGSYPYYDHNRASSP